MKAGDLGLDSGPASFSFLTSSIAESPTQLCAPPTPPHPTPQHILFPTYYIIYLFAMATVHVNHSLFTVGAQGVGDFCQFCAKNTWNTEMLTSE